LIKAQHNNQLAWYNSSIKESVGYGLADFYDSCPCGAISYRRLNAQEAKGEETKRREEIHRPQPAKSSAAQSDVDQEFPRISPAKSWGMRCLTEKSLLGLLVSCKKIPSSFADRFFLRNEKTGQRETIFETRTRAGKIISTHPILTIPLTTIRDPTLLAEKEAGLIVGRFGQIVEPPE
jgi:hypothetical protein